jgi:hypothetical protein
MNFSTKYFTRKKIISSRMLPPIRVSSHDSPIARLNNEKKTPDISDTIVAMESGDA